MVSVDAKIVGEIRFAYRDKNWRITNQRWQPFTVHLNNLPFGRISLSLSGDERLVTAELTAPTI